MVSLDLGESSIYGGLAMRYEPGEYVKVVKEITTDSWGTVMRKNGCTFMVSIDDVIDIKNN